MATSPCALQSNVTNEKGAQRDDFDNGIVVKSAEPYVCQLTKRFMIKLRIEIKPNIDSCA